MARLRMPGAGRGLLGDELGSHRKSPAESTSPTSRPNDVGPTALRSVLASRPSSGGSTLPKSVGDDLARTTGQPRAADRIRVHRDRRSERAAGALSADAFTVGTDIHLGATASGADHRLLLHEATHALQQEGGGASTEATGLSQPDDVFETNADAVVEAASQGDTATVTTGASGLVQRKVSDDIKENLSYSIIDWAITDAEATDAFAMLSELSDAELQTTVTELGAKYVTRLIDNLPTALKTGPEYERIVQAAGPAGTFALVTDNLTRGLFDWAVTDAEVLEVYNVYANLTDAQKSQFWRKLEEAGLVDRLIAQGSAALERLYVRPWISTVPRGEASSAWQKAAMKSMIMETDSKATADLLLETRFDLSIDSISASNVIASGDNKRTKREFSVAQMRKLWTVLEALPPGHVSNNPELDRVTNFAENTGAWYFWGTDEASLGGSGSDASFVSNLRHEVGHSVDAKIGWRASGEHLKAERGGWIEYAGSLEAAQDAVTLSDEGIRKLPAADRADVEAEMSTVMDDHSKGLSDLRAAIRGLTFGATPEEDRDDAKAEAVRDPALRAVVNNRNISGKKPWWRDDGGVRLGATPRIIQERSNGNWVSYDYTFRKDHGISKYQFRAPGEWFAEVYTKYYTPGEDGRDLLHRKDPNTEQWFTDNVHGA